MPFSYTEGTAPPAFDYIRNAADGLQRGRAGKGFAPPEMLYDKDEKG
jgi:hypothetical protein